MKRLLKISLDLALLSFTPVLSWFCLSLIIDKNLINIFTLTYPIQFINYILKSIFSTGANISKEKDKDNNIVMSGIIIGSIISLIIFGFIIINIENYINFMHMDISTYKTFTIYSVIQLNIQLLFIFIMEKLYYEDKNNIANKYSLKFSLLNCTMLIGTSLLIKNQVISISITLLSIFSYTIYVAIKSRNKFKFHFNILKCIKYDSTELLNNLAFFFIFLFGLSNTTEFGEEFTLALTFIALITDTQWDVFDAISTVAKIDISKNKFNYKEHKNNSYKLLLILFITIFILFIALYSFYELNILLVMIYFCFEIINFSIYPLYTIKTCFLQLEYSAIKTTINKTAANILRTLVSLLKTPFCTGLGQISSSIYQLISANILFNNNYKISKDGSIIKKTK